VVPSTLQIQYENNLSAVSNAWGYTLTAAQRLQWINCAKDQVKVDRLGQTRAPSGFELFVARNMIRLTGAYPITLTPLGAPKACLFTGLTAQWVGASGYVLVLLSFSGSAASPDFEQFWRAGPFKSPARQPQKPDYRFLMYKKPPASWHDYGVVSGNYYWYRARGCDISGVTYKWFEVQVYVS
jgi:hypothetical protein